LLTVALLKDWRMLRRVAVALLFVVVTYLALRFPAEHIPAPTPSESAPAVARPLLAARAFAEYTGLFVLPLQLHMERDVETQPFGTSNESLAAVSRRELQTLLGAALFARSCIGWRKNGGAIRRCSPASRSRFSRTCRRVACID
jgi:hypothetical protein